MTIVQTLLLGILQGVAEFLPISSSGHLLLAQHLFGLKDVPLLFDVALHVATLLAVVIFFRLRLWELIKAFVRWIARKPMTDVKGTSPLTATDADSRRTVEAVIFATIATGAIGIITERVIKIINPATVCVMFLITAVILITAQAIPKTRKSHTVNALSPTLWMAVFIGIAQGVGTLPGISRSGITISAALLCGLTLEAAGEFSFIVSIPAILGAFVLQLKDAQIAAEMGVLPFAVGGIAAFAAGYLSLALFMRLIKRGHLAWFAAYLIPAAIVGLVMLRVAHIQ